MPIEKVRPGVSKLMLGIHSIWIYAVQVQTIYKYVSVIEDGCKGKSRNYSSHWNNNNNNEMKEN